MSVINSITATWLAPACSVVCNQFVPPLPCSMISGSHFDEWVVDYTHFEPGPPPASLFATPRLCKDSASLQVVDKKGRRGAHLRWAALAPAVRYRGDAQVGHAAASTACRTATCVGTQARSAHRASFPRLPHLESATIKTMPCLAPGSAPLSVLNPPRAPSMYFVPTCACPAV
jgi:hypothetical protein